MGANAAVSQATVDPAINAEIGAGGTVGAGSVITKDTPAGALSVARGRQAAIANWDRPKKKSS